MMLETTVIFLLYLSFTSASCPNIISREQWGAALAITKSLGIHPATHVVVHHSSSPTCTSFADCAAIVRSIQTIHMKRKRYRDIGYNFLIGEDGNVYEGVGWGKEGTHEDRFNYKSIGICVIGDYTSWTPNEAAQSAMKHLIECGVAGGHISPRYKLIGHRQVKHTDCPGSKLHYLIRGWENWSSAP